MTHDISCNDGSCYSQYGNHMIDRRLGMNRQHAYARIQTDQWWQHLATQTRGGYGTRASARDPTSKPGVHRIAWLALLIQLSGSNRVLPSWQPDIHNMICFWLAFTGFSFNQSF